MNPFYEKIAPSVQLKTITERDFPMHIHPQIELLVVFEGMQGMCINGIEYTASAGDCMIVFPNIVHSLVSKGDSNVNAPLIIFSLNVIPDYKHVFLSKMPSSPLVRLDQEEFAQLKFVIQNMYKAKPDAKQDMLLKGYIYMILAYIVGQQTMIERPTNTIISGSSDLLLRIIDFIGNNFSEQLTLDYVASHLNISSIHLSHIFSTQLRMNFRTYINAIRINYAQNLLRSSDMSITDICYLCGFNNQKTFNGAFKKICGITPREYRSNRTL